MVFSICPTFKLILKNDRYEDSPESFFLFIPRSTPRGFRSDLLKKLNYFLTTRLIVAKYGSPGPKTLSVRVTLEGARDLRTDFF